MRTILTVIETCWRCLRGELFFNRDASLEIDRLTVENEQLRARCIDLERGAA